MSILRYRVTEFSELRDVIEESIMTLETEHNSVIQQRDEKIEELEEQVKDLTKERDDLQSKVEVLENAE